MADRKALAAQVADLKAVVEDLRTEIMLLRAGRSCCGHHCIHYHVTPPVYYPPAIPYTVTVSNGGNQTIGGTTTTYVQNTAGGIYPSIGN